MWRILIFILVFAPIPGRAQVAAPCLAYELVSLRGTVVRQFYPGPPDYESVTKGDEPQFYWVLVLDQRICVGDSAYVRRYEREIQLVSGPDQSALYRELLGEKVIVTGMLRPGGARDEKRLVLAGREVRRAGVFP